MKITMKYKGIIFLNWYFMRILGNILAIYTLDI